MNENQQWDKVQERPSANFRLSLPVESYDQPYILPAMMCYSTVLPPGNSPEPQCPGFLLEVGHVDMADHRVADLGFQPLQRSS